MNKTTFEKGIERGVEIGVEKGREMERREMVRERIVEKFGALPAAVEEKLQHLPLPELI